MPGWPSTGTTRSAIVPTARIAACGELTIALKASTLYMPRLLMVKVAPATSDGRKRPRPGPLRHFPALPSDFTEGRDVGVGNYGHHRALLDRHRNADVYFLMKMNAIGRPACIHPRMVDEGPSQ